MILCKQWADFLPFSVIAHCGVCKSVYKRRQVFRQVFQGEAIKYNISAHVCVCTSLKHWSWVYMHPESIAFTMECCGWQRQAHVAAVSIVFLLKGMRIVKPAPAWGSIRHFVTSDISSVDIIQHALTKTDMLEAWSSSPEFHLSTEQCILQSQCGCPDSQCSARLPLVSMLSTF